jgi:GTP-binding protein
MRNVVIVGRPNVGKSALFNRLASRKISIVHDQPGVTRDRLTAICQLGSAPFEIVDTGGIGFDPDPDFSGLAQEAAATAIEGSDLLLFVVDGQSGLTPLDLELAGRLRRSRRPTILVVNKVDAPEHEAFPADFARLGFSQTLGVSAAHGGGVADLVEAIEGLLPPASQEDEPKEAPRVAFIGRPNVGKSSLINMILGDRRTIVSHIPGTTRDAVDIACERDARCFILCDTAGIRHRSKHKASVEVFSVMRAENAIRRADLCVLVIDAESGVTLQDKKVAGLIQKAHKAALVALNKWDMVSSSSSGRSNSQLLVEHTERVRESLFFLDYAPVVALSAKTGANVGRLFTTIEKIAQHATRRATTGELNRLLRAVMERQPPPLRGKRRLKLLYATQLVPPSPRPFQAPEFLLFVNDPRLLPASYVNFLRARLRERWQYPGLPILLHTRGRQKREAA